MFRVKHFCRSALPHPNGYPMKAFASNKMLPKNRRQPRGWRHQQNGERELLVTLWDRYRNSSKKDKGRILDEFRAIDGHHHKHGVRLLRHLDEDEEAPGPTRGRLTLR